MILGFRALNFRVWGWGVGVRERDKGWSCKLLRLLLDAKPQPEVLYWVPRRGPSFRELSIWFYDRVLLKV